MSDPKKKAELLRKARDKKENSLTIKIMESDLYDWNPTMRMTLLVIAFGQRTNENAYVPEDMPDDMKNDMLGWCDMAQWRLALRVGVTTDHMNKIIAAMEDHTIQVRSWTDDNNTEHNQYQVIASVVEEHQRPEQKKDVERPPRYKKKRGANKGSFSATNQPKKRGFDRAKDTLGAAEVPDADEVFA